MSNLSRRLTNVNRLVEGAAKDMHRKFVSETPIDTGNARRRTDLSGNEIQANYDYSIRLEKEGWSRQAPSGMSAPTIAWQQQRLRGL